MYFLSYLLEAVVPGNSTVGTELCPLYSTFFGSMGSFFSMALTCVGSAYGTAKASVGISSMGVMKPELVMKAILPVIFAGIVPIYGIIISIMITGHCLYHPHLSSPSCFSLLFLCVLFVLCSSLLCYLFFFFFFCFVSLRLLCGAGLNGVFGLLLFLK